MHPAVPPQQQPPGSPTARRHLLAGGCFAALMLGALVAAFLLNRRDMPADVLQAMLDQATRERDQARAALAAAENRAAAPEAIAAPLQRPAVHVVWTGRAARIRLAEPAAFRVTLGGESHGGTTRELLVQIVTDNGHAVAGRSLAADLPDVETFRLPAGGAAADPPVPPLPERWEHQATFDRLPLRLTLANGAQITFGDGDAHGAPVLDLSR